MFKEAAKQPKSLATWSSRVVAFGTALFFVVPALAFWTFAAWWLVRALVSAL